MIYFEIVDSSTDEIVETKAFLSLGRVNQYAKSLGKKFYARRISNRITA